jgi:hypothetical protein
VRYLGKDRYAAFSAELLDFPISHIGSVENDAAWDFQWRQGFHGNFEVMEPKRCRFGDQNDEIRPHNRVDHRTGCPGRCIEYSNFVWVDLLLDRSY